MPLFSVVIASFNRAQLVKSTLDSVRTQEFKDYEVIVVDDGSTDKTLEVLRSYPEVKILTQNNKGPGQARNYGVSRSSGKYIAFLDSDDLWFPWTLSSFAEAIAKHNEPDLLSGRLQEFVEVPNLERAHREPLRVHAFEDYYASSGNPYFVGACMMTVKKTAFEKVGGFTDKRIYAEDCDLALRLGLVNGFVKILSPVTLAYRVHPENARRDHGMIFKGTWNLIESERGGRYPGGMSRRVDRLSMVTLHVRPVSLESLQAGCQRYAWQLYFRTLLWNLRIARWKYVLGFPLLALKHAVRSRTHIVGISPNKHQEPGTIA